MTKKYPSKVSYGLLFVIFLIFFAPLISNLINPDQGLEIDLVTLFLFLVFGFVLHLFFKTEYTIEHGQLKIRCGFFSFKPIAISDIREVSKTNSLISAPAASFDRIEIKYREFDEVIISPKDKLNFVKDLMKINPNIKNKMTE